MYLHSALIVDVSIAALGNSNEALVVQKRDCTCRLLHLRQAGINVAMHCSLVEAVSVERSVKNQKASGRVVILIMRHRAQTPLQ